MLFNSNNFLLFFAVFYLAYLPLKSSPTCRNGLIVIGSLIFYGSWSIPFLLLMLFTATADFFVGLLFLQAKSETVKRSLLCSSLVLNLGILVYFKYSGFARELWSQFVGVFGERATFRPFSMVLPVGISFYTFQSISYVFDVYRGVMRPERNWIKFLAFVSFFPQLVSGPIERAPRLFPQFSKIQLLSAIGCSEAAWLLAWGFFKKVVIADNIAPYVDLVFGNESFASGLYGLATLAFGIQIYCDFSGYSDIASGLAKLLGFEIMSNFNLPYFSRSLREFWTRWHISLSSWFRDYLYLPLGGNRFGLERTCRNIVIVMVVAGIWHGAGWPFIFWGSWHGLALVVNHIWKATSWRSPGSAISWLLTSFVVFFGWFLFRVHSLQQVYEVLVLNRGLPMPFWTHIYVRGVILFSLPLLLVEVVQFFRDDRFWPVKLPWFLQTLLYGIVLAPVIAFWEKEGSPFIYFQF